MVELRLQQGQGIQGQERLYYVIFICFPFLSLSPLFTLLGGLACTLYSAGGQATEGDSSTVAMPGGVSIFALYVTTLAISMAWLLVIPLYFNFRLTKWTSILGFCMYAVFVAVYALCTYAYD